MPIYEPGLPELVHATSRPGRLSFTTDTRRAVAGAEVAFICVGTPMERGWQADLRYVESRRATSAAA
jgi:UDPglucose 6-dehydrogenase